MERIEIDHVEPSENGTIDQERADPVERAGRTNEGDDPAGRVLSIDGDGAGTYRLYVVRRGEHHGRDRGTGISPVERPVVDPHDARVGLGERPPQG